MKFPIFYSISRYLVAALFLFSGFAKGVNPFGLSIQFGDYFSAMGLDWLRPMSVVGAIVLPATEFMLGAMLLCGIFRRVTAWGALIFMSFFTLLTLWIAIYDPVKDCGCFGDLLIISNWATFWKNILFMVFTIGLFVGRKGADRHSYITLVVIALLSFVLPAYCYTTLPLIDATPYKIGVNIPAAMSGGSAPEGHTLLVYRNRKSKKIKKFEIEDSTWQDEDLWEFVKTQTSVKKQGYTPPIHSFAMLNDSGEDLSDAIISKSGRTLFFIIPSPDKLTAEERLQIAKIANRGDRTVLLHSSVSAPQIDGVEAFTMDQTTLRTIIQNHRGGAVLIQNGTIIEKWHLRKILSN